MNERYEFAELSFDKDHGHSSGCTFSLLTTPPDDPNMGERNYDTSWVDVLSMVGLEGWRIGGMMEAGILQVIMLQRRLP